MKKRTRQTGSIWKDPFHILCMQTEVDIDLIYFKGTPKDPGMEEITYVAWEWTHCARRGHQEFKTQHFVDKVLTVSQEHYKAKSIHETMFTHSSSPRLNN